MKIGILTHHYISNFGAFLQAYALQEAVKKLFPQDEVHIINFIHIKHFIINTGGWFRIYGNRETPRAWLQKIRLPFTFHKARGKYLRQTKPCFFARDINRLQFDCVIVGSDEVWNYRDTKSNARLKFGCGLTCRKLIAYAPSVGKSDPSQGVPDYVSTGLKSFDAVSARDDLTKAFVESVAGVTPVRVLDPTFLTDFPLAKRVVPDKPYILFYYCEHLPQEYLDQIISFAAENGYAVYGAGECGKIYSAVTVNLTPFEWVQMFRDARMVFTGTFHGAVFSILNQKQFFCYLTNQSRIKKVGALLRELGISDRIIAQGFCLNDARRNVIDYNAVSANIAAKKEASISFLKQSIGEDTHM